MNGHLYRICTKEGVERLVDVFIYGFIVLINVTAVTIGVNIMITKRLQGLC
jgi:hypothetical protein